MCPSAPRARLQIDERADCIDERDQRVLVVGEGKQAIEYAVTGGVQLLTPLLSQGKCTLIIVKRNLRILVSDADAAELRAWCGSLASGRPPPPKASVPAPSPLPKRTLSRASPSSANRLTPRVEKKKARDLDIASPDWSDAGGPSLSPGAADALTDEQAEVLRAALSGTSLFFTGGAGTGKSFLLREIIKRLPAATTSSRRRRRASPRATSAASRCTTLPGSAAASGRSPSSRRRR